jgi:hypothetical protein
MDAVRAQQTERLPVLGFGWRDVLRMAAWPLVGLTCLAVVILAALLLR